MKKCLIAFFAAVAVAASCCGHKDGEYTFRVLTTNDVHGRYFDSLYVTDMTSNALTNISWYRQRNAQTTFLRTTTRQEMFTHHYFTF